MLRVCGWLGDIGIWRRAAYAVGVCTTRREWARGARGLFRVDAMPGIDAMAARGGPETFTGGRGGRGASLRRASTAGQGGPKKSSRKKSRIRASGARSDSPDEAGVRSACSSASSRVGDGFDRGQQRLRDDHGPPVAGAPARRTRRFRRRWLWALTRARRRAGSGGSRMRGRKPRSASA